MSTVPLSASEVAKLEKDLQKADLPADINIPDNYVDHTLKNTKPLPPVTWSNWWKELNYLSLAILTITPAVALYGSFTTKLRWETGIFAVMYYFITGWGVYLFCRRPLLFFTGSLLIVVHCRHYSGLPPFMGPSLIQCIQAFAVLSCSCWCGCSGGVYQVVVSWTSRAPQIHGHGARPV